MKDTDSTNCATLWLDASGAVVCAALHGGGAGPGIHACAAEPADVCLPGMVQNLLEKSGLRVTDIKAFSFCRGPGSSLGIRTSVMMLRTWLTLPAMEGTVCNAWLSTCLLAGQVAQATASVFRIAVPMGRLAWALHDFRADGHPQSPEPVRCAADALPDFRGPTYYPSGAKVWGPPPPGFIPVEYDPVRAWKMVVSGKGLPCPVSVPDGWPAQPPQFRKIGQPVFTAPVEQS
jgi:hypothetical protein